MELKIWVDGIQRIVCGVTEETTCQDVVHALAHATGRTGKFTLTERWRNNERLLSPQENPLKVLLKWGEYSNDVQFILQYTGGNGQDASPIKISSSQRKLSFSPRRADSIGIVKGVPKQTAPLQQSPSKPIPIPINISPNHHSRDCGQAPIRETKSPHYDGEYIYSRPPPAYKEPPNPSGGIRMLPPYREPPPPNKSPARISPMAPRDCNIMNSSFPTKRNLIKECTPEVSVYTPQYRDLVRLINFQRDKLSVQQAELTKYDAEIIYWEGKAKEQQYQIEALAKDAAHLEEVARQADEQLRGTGQIEEEVEMIRQQDRTLRSEMTLLRSKLSNCETELLLCKNKIRLLMDEIKMEKRILARDHEERTFVERSTRAEVDRLQCQAEQMMRDADAATKMSETLRKEVGSLETSISEKKNQVEKLVSDMKEANLKSLAICAPEEIKMIMEGSWGHKLGSTRKIVGSPRQLENAVPTSKNPNGVWV